MTNLKNFDKTKATDLEETTSVSANSAQKDQPVAKKSTKKPRNTSAKRNPTTKTTNSNKNSSALAKNKILDLTNLQTEKTPISSNSKNQNEGGRIFALDVGTRSVIGIVAEKKGNSLKVIASERMEHKTRAMLDGQIHDVTQVAEIIKAVKEALIKKTGPITAAAVAAAGRALYTMTAEAELRVHGVISEEQARSLDYAGVQAAQAKLATSHVVDDPTTYYCVGYSTISYELDGIQLKSLVGQRGKQAKVNVIATFLPRQVIDSMQSALESTGLDMQALTLEPIAAINVLIPPTMRHLNLVLVDIGAGTSDVAITKNGAVVAYGMVPLAGDEITEAISQKFLLDFNVAEEIKRKASSNQPAKFTDILGIPYELTPEEVIKPIETNIQNLAGAIARQITELNGPDSPQAVILVGGGSLTPNLSHFVAEDLKMPENRVAVRHPDNVNGIENIPDELKRPDAVTPLGILKVASINTLHFMRVFVNEEEYSLFNFRDMTVSDALLNAGIQLRRMNGKPGLAVTVTVDGETKIIPGGMGSPAKIFMNKTLVDMDTPLEEECSIIVEPGKDGTTPKVSLRDVVKDSPIAYEVVINGEITQVKSIWQVNGLDADMDMQIFDGDVVRAKEVRNLRDLLKAVELSAEGKKIKYTLNGSSAIYTIAPNIVLNNAIANLDDEVNPKDEIEYSIPDMPKLGKVLNISEKDSMISVYYKNQEFKLQSAGVSIEVNGHPASMNTLIQEDSNILYGMKRGSSTTVSEALLAVGFVPPSASSRVKFTITVNGKPVTFTDSIKNNDTIDVILEEPTEKPTSAYDSMLESDKIMLGLSEDVSKNNASNEPLTKKQKYANREAQLLEELEAIKSLTADSAPKEEEKPKESAPVSTSTVPSKNSSQMDKKLSMLERLGFSTAEINNATAAIPSPLKDGIVNKATEENTQENKKSPGYEPISPFSRFSSSYKK